MDGVTSSDSDPVTTRAILHENPDYPRALGSILFFSYFVTHFQILPLLRVSPQSQENNSSLLRYTLGIPIWILTIGSAAGRGLSSRRTCPYYYSFFHVLNDEN